MIFNVDRLSTAKEKCVIYSLGVNEDISFEAGALAATPCHVHSFDCTIAAPPPSPDPARHTFHPLCIAAADSADGRYKRLSTIMKTLGHKELAYIKVDIEGYEFDVIDSWYAAWLEDPSVPLPMQAAFEIHSAVGMVGRIDTRDTLRKMLVDLMRKVVAMGYVIVSREDNPWCDRCTEIVIVRALCGKPGQVLPQQHMAVLE